MSNNVEIEKNMDNNKSKIPHIYVLLFIIISICVAATWILPAGKFDRAKNAIGQLVVVPGTFRTVESTPVNPFQGLIAIYKGMIDAAPIVFFVFIAYASIGFIIKSGAFDGLISRMLRVLKNKKIFIIPIFITLIGAASSTIGVFEEMFPFIPIFVGLALAMGYDAIVGMAIMALGAGIGYSGATINPFTVGIAQGIAEVTPMSGAGFRIVSHLSMIVVASIYVMIYANKIQKDPTKSLVYGDESVLKNTTTDIDNQRFGIREIFVLITLLCGIIAIVIGCKYYDWYFNELCATFLIMGFTTCAIMGWGPNECAKRMAESFSEIAMACMMIAFARGILIVLQEGSIIDSIVYYASIPLTSIPSWLSAESMLLIQTSLNLIIPSGSGQAATSMPIMAPIADVSGVSRQVAVLAFQFGDGLSNILWPTAAMPVICGIAGVKIEKWLKWFIPLFIMLLLTQMILIALAIVVWR